MKANQDHNNQDQLNQERFYIFDCNEQIIGNTSGYRTIRGALKQSRSRKMQDVIWSTFEARENKKDNYVSRVGYIKE